MRDKRIATRGNAHIGTGVAIAWLRRVANGYSTQELINERLGRCIITAEPFYFCICRLGNILPNNNFDLQITQQSSTRFVIVQHPFSYAV